MMSLWLLSQNDSSLKVNPTKCSCNLGEIVDCSIVMLLVKLIVGV